MPVKIPDALPATRILTEENVFVMTEKRSQTQDIRPLRIAILNLMPTKEKTETQLLRLISNSPLQVEITLLRTGTYEATHTSLDYLDTFYRTLSDVENEFFDGLIITGAPVEKLDFADVLYWEELTRVMDWADQRVFSTLFICWAAQAGLYYHYGIQKHPLSQKLFGVFDTSITDPYDRLLCGLDDTFTVPMSRHTALDEEALARCAEVTVLATSPETGAALVRSKDGRRVFATGHSEYDRDSLAHEYTRDVAKNLPIDLPRHYYPGDDPTQTPPLRWHAHASVLFSNWLNYFVYQETPFDLRQGFAPLKTHYENSQS
ncbi:MAG: homoserine O-succinyltransferase [Candidatus Limiplasma sp.]|nr:homoserine O-succinyltransferase [Candidatus Limiplasma sp.]MEA5146656.1 homoserine O-succinyltransferase [Candidatus Limiplasma sp.]